MDVKEEDRDEDDADNGQPAVRLEVVEQPPVRCVYRRNIKVVIASSVLQATLCHFPFDLTVTRVFILFVFAFLSGKGASV
jgi:hypothetical protein